MQFNFNGHIHTTSSGSHLNLLPAKYEIQFVDLAAGPSSHHSLPKIINNFVDQYGSWTMYSSHQSLSEHISTLALALEQEPKPNSTSARLLLPRVDTDG